MEREVELAEAAAAGDAAAFTMLVRIHEGAVRRFLRRLAGDGASDDLAQEVFLRAWRMSGRWRREGIYKSWLMGIAWKAFLDYHRAQGRRGAREQVAFENSQLRRSDANCQIDVARALAELPERERAAALLCFGEGYSHGEAARIMGIPLGTLKSTVARARTTLAKRLEEV